jgi:hypothetical protein
MAEVEQVGQTVDLVDLAVVEMEQIMLVTVVIADRLTVAVAVAETGTQVVNQVVLDKL